MQVGPLSACKGRELAMFLAIPLAPLQDAARDYINRGWSIIPVRGKKTDEQLTGVKRQFLMKFMAGEQSRRLDIADKLAAYFSLELTKRKSR